MRHHRLLVGCLAALCLPSLSFLVHSASAQRQSDAAAEAAKVEFFEKSIRPLVLQRCTKCHGPKIQEANLRLDHAIGWQRGGVSGPIINGKSLEESLALATAGTEQLNQSLQMLMGHVTAITNAVND